MLDVHDPTNISLAGTYNAPEKTTYGYGKALATAGSTLLLGRSYVPGSPELSLLLSATSTAPTVESSLSIATPANPASIEDLLVRDFLTYVLTDTTLELWNISSPQSPTPYAANYTLPNQSSGTSLACKDNSLYVSSVDVNHNGYLTVLTGS